jgi:hypothetical protein
VFKNEIDCLIGSIEANDAGNPFENEDELIRSLQRSAIAARLPVGPLYVFTSNNGDEGPRRRIANGFKAYRPGQAPRSGIPPALSWIYSGLRGSKPWERTAREWNPIRKKLIAILRQWANFGAAPLAQSAFRAAAEDESAITATLVDIAHDEATSFLYLIRHLCSWDAAESVDSWAKSLLALLGECEEHDSNEQARSILQAALPAFAATRAAPYVLGKKSHASAHAAVLTLWRRIAIAAERTDGLYRRAKTMLPKDADLSAGDGIAGHLFAEALRPCLSGQSLDDRDASSVEKYWPGLSGRLQADPQIQGECEKLRRGECVFTLQKQDGKQKTSSISKPTWLSDLQKDLFCDVDAVQAELEIEYAKAAQYESTKSRDRNDAPRQTGGRGNAGQSDTEELTNASPGALSKEAKALAALADHPRWTDEQIAQAAGCNRQSLYRMKKFVAAKRLLKAGRDTLPAGTKDGETGEVQAWDNRDDGE